MRSAAFKKKAARLSKAVAGKFGVHALAVELGHHAGAQGVKIADLLRDHEPLIQSVFRKLGGRQELGTTISSDADLARIVHQGISVTVLDHLSKAGFSSQEIEHFVIPARTLRHRKAKHEPLTLEESDRVIRITRTQAIAEDVFGDAGKANRWLREALGILDGKSPLEIARSEAGARVVEQILAKIDWGAAA